MKALFAAPLLLGLWQSYSMKIIKPAPPGGEGQKWSPSFLAFHDWGYWDSYLVKAISLE